MSITAIEQSNLNHIKLAYGIPVSVDGTAVDALTNNSTDSTPDDTVAAAGATIVATPTAYTAHASGGTTVTSNAATDLDTTAAALDTLRDEVAALVVALNARFVIIDSNISDCAAKINELITLIG